MIGRLTGRIELLDATTLLVDAGGVGYLVSASSRTLSALPSGGEGRVEVETHVREDQITLFGFATMEEKRWFKLLTGVQGVGGRVALAILSALSPDELVAAILSEDKKAMARADGVGPRLAARLVTELKDRVGDFAAGAALATAASTPAAGNVPDSADSSAADAVSALVNLGYGRSEAFTVVSRVRQAHAEAGIDDLIRASLRELSA